MKRLWLVLVIFYGLGIILANFLKLNFWVITGLAGVIFSSVIFFKNKNYIFLGLILILAFFLGWLNLKNSYLLPKCQISNFVDYQDASVYHLNGFIDSVPELKNNCLGFIFRVQEAQKDQLKWGCCGKILVKMDFFQELKYGDNLRLSGNLSRPPNFKNSQQSFKNYLSRQDIYLIMRLKDPRQIIRRFGFSGSVLIRNSFWLRIKMEQIINRYLTELPAGILCAMVLGQKRGVPWLVNDAMIKSGTVHILVVSGFNVGIVAFIINLLFKILRIRRKIRIVLTIICILIYCLVTGATNPVIRATVMGIVFLSAYLLKRDPDIYNSLATAALFILMISPRQILDIGFQLSFVSVLAIVYLYPKLRNLIALENCKNKIKRFIYEGALVSFSAWLGTAGIIAFNFGIIAPVTVLANILIVPLATLITLSGFALVLVGLICPALAHLFSLPISLLINLLLQINAMLIKLPYAYIVFDKGSRL